MVTFLLRPLLLCASSFHCKCVGIREVKLNLAPFTLLFIVLGQSLHTTLHLHFTCEWKICTVCETATVPTYCHIMKLLCFLWCSAGLDYCVAVNTEPTIPHLHAHPPPHKPFLSLTLKNIQHVACNVDNSFCDIWNHRYNKRCALLCVFCKMFQSIGNWAIAIHFLSTADRDTFCCILSVLILHFASDNHLALGMKRDTVVHCQKHWPQNRVLTGL